MIEYDQSWFERMWYKSHNFLFQDLWVKQFRMSPETFEFVVDLVRENIEKYWTNFRHAIKVGKRAAVGIWRLATGNSYRTFNKVSGNKSFFQNCSRLCKGVGKISFAIYKISENKLRNCTCSSVVQITF